MAVLGLRTDLTTGADTGGSWKFTGSTLITSITVDGGAVSLNIGDTVGVNDDPQIDFCSIVAPAGTYTFVYTIPAAGGCPSDSTTVTLIIQDSPTVNADVTLDVCIGDPVINLFNQLGAGTVTGGTWGGAGTSHAGYTAGADETLSTFDPANGTIVPPETFVFTYTVAGNPTANGCPCADAVQTLTINVNDVFDAGTGGTVEVCQPPA